MNEPAAVRVPSSAIELSRWPVRLDGPPLSRSVRSPKGKQWQPPEALMPDQIKAVIAAAACERDRLLMRCLWATGGRISEVLALRPSDIARDSLVIPNRKNVSRPFKRAFLSAGDADLPGELLLWAQEQGIAGDGPLFPSAKHDSEGKPKAISRQQAWLIVRTASDRAGVRVLAMRPSKYGDAGQAAPIHCHLFRHARIRQILRSTKSLPLAQKQAGWRHLMPQYLTIGDDEARQMMGTVGE